MPYISSFIKIGSSIQNLIGGIHRQQGDHINLIYLFLNTGRRLKNLNSAGDSSATRSPVPKPVQLYCFSRLFLNSPPSPIFYM
jgi:hypothetical protein